MRDGLDVARELLPSLRLDHPTALEAGDRNSVTRARAVDAERNTGTVIVKQFQQAGEGWVREVAALTTLPAELGSPRILASSAAPPMIVMTDVGDGPNLADGLLGDDPQDATEALTRWAEALAHLHVATRDRRERFVAALDKHAGDLPVTDTRIGTDIEDAVRKLDLACGSLGISVPSGALDEFHGLAHRLGADGAAAITPADACPDNNVRRADRTVFLDFEGAQWRHIAWDVAYLRVPWPTCWCAWRLPDDAADTAVAAYRAIATDAFPEVGTDVFDHDVAAASVGWSLLSASWMLDTALHAELPLAGRAAAGPTRRAMLLGRLRHAGRSCELPAAAELAARLADELARRWGDVPLEHAPAFRSTP